MKEEKEHEFIIKLYGTKGMIKKFVEEIEEACCILGFPKKEFVLPEEYGYSCSMLEFYSEDIKSCYEGWLNDLDDDNEI